jgi:hypothetical protein
MLTSVGLSQDIPYTQLVFPDDINKFPLLFTSELELEENIYNIYVKRFIADQARIRKVNHELISEKNLTNYSIIKYKYQICPVNLNLRIFNAEYGSRSYSKVVSFIIINRETGKHYRPFANIKPISKSSYDATYPDSQLEPAKTKSYFTKLERIINKIEKKGSIDTFKKEIKKQRRNGTNLMIPMLIIGIALGPVIGILIS